MSSKNKTLAVYLTLTGTKIYNTELQVQHYFVHQLRHYLLKLHTTHLHRNSRSSA